MGYDVASFIARSRACLQRTESGAPPAIPAGFTEFGDQPALQDKSGMPLQIAVNAGALARLIGEGSLSARDFRCLNSTTKHHVRRLFLHACLGGLRRDGEPARAGPAWAASGAISGRRS